MRSLALTLFSAFASALLAQSQVKIIHADALANAPSVRKDKAAVQAIAKGGFSDEETDQILQYGDRDQWPTGIRTEDSLKANAPYVVNYVGFRLCAYQGDTCMMALIMVPAKENLHMPNGMRPLADFYVALPERALQNVQERRNCPAISRGPAWKRKPKVKIIKPDELFGAYDLSSDSVGLKALADAGMSRPEIDAVVFRSTERNWPDGIDSFDERYPLLAKFTKYHAYLGAKWDDKVLVIVPVERNKRMPVAMRPFVDLYFVYAKAGVKLGK
jgi:hypothetical protein